MEKGNYNSNQEEGVRYSVNIFRLVSRHLIVSKTFDRCIYSLTSAVFLSPLFCHTTMVYKVQILTVELLVYLGKLYRALENHR